MFIDADAPKAFKEEGGLGILGPVITVLDEWNLWFPLVIQATTGVEISGGRNVKEHS